MSSADTLDPSEADTLNSLLDRSASSNPGAIALVVPEGASERSVTFSELRNLALRAAAAFKARGVAKGDCVAVVHRNGLGFVAAYFGLARLGAIAVPINFMVQKADELAFMLDHCKAKGVVTALEFLPGLLKARQKLPLLASVWLTDGPAPDGTEDFWRFVGGAAPLGDPMAPRVSADDTASILYTSGTTGRPKGVMLTHANLVSNCDASIAAMRLCERDVFLCILPMFHTFAWTACVLIPLRLGGKIVAAPSIAPASPWLGMMARHGVTVFAAVPQVYAVLSKQACGLKGLALRWWFFRKVRICVSGAAPLNARTASAFKRTVGLEIFEGYGLTETSPVATINAPGRHRRGSVGPPIEGVEVRVVGEDGRPLARGEEGEILIRGPNVMRGYHDDPRATVETLSAEGWLRTGDIGALDAEGYLFIRDRKKDMIIVKGLKVFSAQVEAVLLEHPAVEEAAVVGVPDEAGDETIKAFLVLKKGAEADKPSLLRFCRERLDAYKRPRDLEIVPELPKNALQKVLKRVLRQRELEKAGR